MISLGFGLIGFGIGGTFGYYYMKKRCIVLNNDTVKMIKRIKHII